MGGASGELARHPLPLSSTDSLLPASRPSSHAIAPTQTMECSRVGIASDKRARRSSLKCALRQQLKQFREAKTTLLSEGLSAYDSVHQMPDRYVSGADWWKLYGNDLPELQALAIRVRVATGVVAHNPHTPLFSQVLSVPVSASSTERNWSLFGHFFDKRRCRMLSETLTHQIFVSTNRRALRRYE